MRHNLAKRNHFRPIPLKNDRKKSPSTSVAHKYAINSPISNSLFRSPISQAQESPSLRPFTLSRPPAPPPCHTPHPPAIVAPMDTSLLIPAALAGAAVGGA